MRPRCGKALFRLGIAYFALQRYADAEAAYCQAIQARAPCQAVHLECFYKVSLSWMPPLSIRGHVSDVTCSVSRSHSCRMLAVLAELHVGYCEINGIRRLGWAGGGAAGGCAAAAQDPRQPGHHAGGGRPPAGRLPQLPARALHPLHDTHSACCARMSWQCPGSRSFEDHAAMTLP